MVMKCKREDCERHTVTKDGFCEMHDYSGWKFPEPVETELEPAETEFERLVKEECDKLADVLIRKNHDYQDSYFKSVEKYGESVVLIRVGDKFNRLENLILTNNVPRVNEKLEETLSDLVGYGILELVRRRRNVQ